MKVRDVLREGLGRDMTLGVRLEDALVVFLKDLIKWLNDSNQASREFKPMRFELNERDLEIRERANDMGWIFTMSDGRFTLISAYTKKRMKPSVASLKHVSDVIFEDLFDFGVVESEVRDRRQAELTNKR